MLDVDGEHLRGAELLQEEPILERRLLEIQLLDEHRLRALGICEILDDRRFCRAQHVLDRQVRRDDDLVEVAIGQRFRVPDDAGDLVNNRLATRVIGQRLARPHQIVNDIKVNVRAVQLA
jgi:hypothetical protein